MHYLVAPKGCGADNITSHNNIHYTYTTSKSGLSELGGEFLADQLTLSQPGGQIIPITLLGARAHQIFIPSYGLVDLYVRLIVIIEFSKSSILIKFHFTPL
jgi:hypothetical protein